MRDDIDCRRPPLWERRAGMVPAWIYNQASILLHRDAGPVYVPLRYVSVMAILSSREWVFCDFIGGKVAVTVWHHFAPQLRQDLQDAVPCQMDLFNPDSEVILRRLPMEFNQALTVALKKQAEKRRTSAQVIALDGRGRDEKNDR